MFGRYQQGQVSVYMLLDEMAVNVYSLLDAMAVTAIAEKDYLDC